MAAEARTSVLTKHLQVLLDGKKLSAADHNKYVRLMRIAEARNAIDNELAAKAATAPAK